MKTVLISPIGLTPAVVTEVLRSRGEVDGITDVCIIATQNENVLASAWIAKMGIDEEYPEITGRKVRTHIHTVALDDIYSTEHVAEFINKITDIVRIEAERYNVRKFLLNLAGARKVESAIMLMLGMIWQVPAVYHVIHKHVSSFSPNLEMLREEIKGILDAKDKQEYYHERKNLFHDVLFPDPHEYEVFEVPFVPLSTTEKNNLKELLRGTEINDSVISAIDIKRYQRMGLLTVSADRTYPTDMGMVFLKALEIL